MSDYLDINNEELLKDFFSEAEQQVEQLESNILVIENDPTNHDAIDEIFRAAHTLKGGSATVEMMELSSFTHKVEDLLDEIRSGSVSVSEQIIDVLLDSIDVIKAMLESRRNGEVFEENISGLVNQLSAFIPEKKAKTKKSKTSVPRPQSLLSSGVAVSAGTATSVKESSSVSSAGTNLAGPFQVISCDDLTDLNQNLARNESLFAVLVEFSVSNIQDAVSAVFSALKEKTSVLKTLPEYDSLLQSDLHSAIYFVGSVAEKSEIISVVSSCEVSSIIEVLSPADAVSSDVARITASCTGSVTSQPGSQVESQVFATKTEATQEQGSIKNPFDTLSESEFEEISQAASGEGTLWCVVVDFDESNPMNSVGGIQVFAALKDVGQLVKTTPDFDCLYEDTFYPEVHYYIVSTQPKEKLEKVAFISDVTLEVVAFEANAHSAGSSAMVATPVVAAMPQQNAVSVVSQEVVATKSEELDVSVPQVVEQDANNLPKKAEQVKKTPAVQHNQGSVLRVDSRRIDYLLNLVSETVITKASFNQNSILFGELQSQLQNVEQSYKEKIRRLLEDVSAMAEDIANGASAKDVKSLISQEYSDVLSMFDPFSNSFKNAVAKFKAGSQNLGRITGELQEGVMKIRMVPISQIFNRFPRVVRDLTRDLGKKVELVIEGEETELDKVVVDDLLDPIMHCVRNSIDHGIETPEIRRAAGKPEEGRVLLKASNEGNLIIIEVADDGAGINVDAVRKKAVERGIIHPNKELTDMESYQLIFEPGFSTAQKITNVSGRGVGLDVVKNSIEKINGTVTVNSEKGKGSRFIIKLPLTLAIIQGLLVKVGKEIYSVPIASVIESIRIPTDEIKRIDNYEVINVRDEVISLLRLNTLFGLPDNNTSSFRYIVIVGTNDKKIGLMVDSLIGEEDVVIKALKDQFTNSPGIAGASILGDGSVSLIIDVSQLVELGFKQEREKVARVASW